MSLNKRHLFRYESRRQPLLPRPQFVRRLGRHFLAASALIGVSLLGGMLGYHWLEGLTWVDAFANAAMILSGMGPLEALKTDAGKVFAALYALYSGLALLAATTILLAPVFHRLLHRFHVEEGHFGGE